MIAAFLLALVPAQSPLPLEPGTYWVYRETYTEYLGALDAHTDDTTRFEVRGSEAHPFLLQTGGADPASAPVEWGDDWLRLPPWTGEDALPMPLHVGRTARAADGAEPGWTVEAEEDVSVPAGTFKALRCALRTSTSESLLWIAPGIGVVRETQGPPGRHPEIERLLLRWAKPVAKPER